MLLLGTTCLENGRIKVSEPRIPELSIRGDQVDIPVRMKVLTEVRTIEVFGYGMIEVRAHGVRVTYGRLPMNE